MTLHGCNEEINKHVSNLKKKAAEAAKKAHAHAKNISAAAHAKAKEAHAAATGAGKDEAAAEKKFLQEEVSTDAPGFSLPTFAGGCLVGMVAMGGVAMAVTRFRGTRRSA